MSIWSSITLWNLLQYSLIEYDLLGVFAKKNFFCCVEMNENHITRLLKSWASTVTVVPAQHSNTNWLLCAIKMFIRRVSSLQWQQRKPKSTQSSTYTCEHDSHAFVCVQTHTHAHHRNASRTNRLRTRNENVLYTRRLHVLCGPLCACVYQLLVFGAPVLHTKNLRSTFRSTPWVLSDSGNFAWFFRIN